MGEKIRTARMQRGLSQTDLSSDLVTPSMISQIEADKARPSYSLLSAIANRLGLPMESFSDDLEDQNIYSTYMKLADYYVLREQPDKAYAVLQTVPIPSSPGLILAQYLLTLARIHRLKRQYIEAIRILEQLREQALRNQDYLMQFHIFKESGHIEYALENLMGAMHEWSHALLLGDRLMGLETLTTVEVNNLLAEICVLIYRLQTRQNNVEEARAYLEQAQTFCKASGRFRDIVDALVKDTEQALKNGEAVKAKTSVENALAVVTTAGWVDQSIWIQAHFPTFEPEAGDQLDTWAQAALATITLHPHSFLEAEITQIERAISQRDIAQADRRLRRCFEILNDYEADGLIIADLPIRLRVQLRINEARLKRLMGETAEAYHILHQLEAELRMQKEHRVLIQVLAWILKWSSEENQSEQVIALTKQIQSLIDAVYERPQQL